MSMNVTILYNYALADKFDAIDVGDAEDEDNYYDNFGRRG